jgi:uncharacterized protein (DUF983 family)
MSEARGQHAGGRILAILGQRCPACLRGRAFKGAVTMNEVCPVCGYRFGREEGYFTGAMYFSYFLAVPVLVVLGGVIWYLRPMWNPFLILALAGALFLPFVPTIFRYSRVLWMHFHWALDPELRRSNRVG